MERKQHYIDFTRCLMDNSFFLIQTFPSFGRALVLEVTWQRCLEANKLGKLFYGICMLWRTLVKSVITFSSLRPGNSFHSCEVKKLTSVRWEVAGRRSTISYQQSRYFGTFIILDFITVTKSGPTHRVLPNFSQFWTLFSCQISVFQVFLFKMDPPI